MVTVAASKTEQHITSLGLLSMTLCRQRLSVIRLQRVFGR
jgi:hypothetical protein